MGRKKKPNPKQAELFYSGCPHHGPENCCEACPGKLSTDGRGFIHPRDAAGRIPVRQCRHCGTYKTRESWSVTDYFACRDCATSIAAAAAGHARSLKTGEPRFDAVMEKAALGWERKATETTDYTGRQIDDSTEKDDTQGMGA